MSPSAVSPTAATAAAAAAAATATTTTAGTAVPEFILPPIVKRILVQKGKHEVEQDHPPFESDFEYLEATAAVESVRLLAFNLKQGLTGAFFNVDLKWMTNRGGGGQGQVQGVGEVGVGNGGAHQVTAEVQQTMNVKQLIQWLQEELLQSLETYRVQQLARMSKKPMLEAFLQAMEATDNESRIIRFAVAIKSGMTGYAKMNSAGSLSNYMPPELDFGLYEPQSGLAFLTTKSINSQLLTDLFQIPVMELFAMANPKSKWVKEQIFQDCKSNILHGIIRSKTWSVKAFMGVEMDLTLFEAIGSEVLRTCLLEDEYFSQTTTGKAAIKMKEMEKGINDDQAGGNDDGSESKKRKEPPKDQFMEEFELAHAAFGGPLQGNVLEILSMARGKQQKLSHDNDDDNNDNKNGDNNDDEKKLDVSMEDATNKKESSAKDAATEEKESSPESSLIKEEWGPYKSDLSYLEDQVRILEMERRLNMMRTSILDDKFNEDKRTFRDRHQEELTHRYYGGRPMPISKMSESQKEEKKQLVERLMGVLKKFEDRVASRLRASNKQMRLEQLCKALKLTKFEKYVILSLMKSMIMPPSAPGHAEYDEYVSRSHHQGPLRASVGALINDFCCGLEEKMKHRSYFYRSSSLVREGIVRLVQSDFMQDLTLCQIDLDRRMFDYMVALDTEFSEVVDGSHLYLPTVELDDVVLPDETKQRVIDVVLNFEKTKKKIRELDVQDKISYGLGQVLLFHGRSGTGKTMLANAIAAKAKKKVLLINFPAIPSNSSGAIIKMLFREAVVNNCILFFDECEALFLTRDKGGTSVNQVLTELEKFDGLCILATNRAVELDEAIHRRVSLAVEFRKPDLIQREKIWQKLHPPKVPMDDGIDFGFLATKFELSGGQIKNCWVSALGMMVQRGTAAITQEYLVQAAKEQIHGQLSMEAFDRSVVPTHGLDSLVVSEAVREALNGIVQAKKAQSVLSNWGFDTLHRSNVGVSALFTGPPGTGKTMAAEAIGYEIGKPLLVVNVAELVSKWVGETGKNIEGIFNDAKSKEAVLVFDEAEGLFGSRTKGDGSTSRHDNMNVGLLLHYIENFPGICIVITNHKDAIDEAFLRRWRHVVGFSPPGVGERERIWKQMVPKACPLDSSVSFANLASRFELKGGEIRQALMRAASKAALRSDEKKRVIKMEDLEAACRQELEKKDQQRLAANMYS